MTDLIISAGQTGANFLNSDLGKFTLDLAAQSAALAGQPDREGPRLEEIQILRSFEGAPIPRLFGRMRLGGQLIWAGKVKEHVSVSERRGSKGDAPKQRNYRYTLSFAIGLCEGEVSRIGRIWIDGYPHDVSDLRYKLYTGSNMQVADTTIANDLGADSTPAFRGLAYLVFEDFDLSAHGNRIPQFNFEVFSKTDASANVVNAVNIIPGATEFGYDPKRFIQVLGRGRGRVENYHLSKTKSDWSFALDDLEESCPNCEWVSLVVTWFGTDLRAGHGRIEPRVVSHEKKTSPEIWSVAGLTRASANEVSQYENRPAYGGTPNDDSIIRAIKDLHARGFKVMFYPFIMMDIPSDSTLPHPSGGVQKPYPWRGRIGCEAGLTAAQKTTAIGKFFNGPKGTASNPRWGLAHMINHYADLCARAGGVEAFLVGTELVGLSHIETTRGVFPFAGHLKNLAKSARAKLPNAKISYAADWTEYGSYYNGETNDTYFPLDEFWADDAVDFIGIDNYVPLSDWRDGNTHLDALAGTDSIYDLDYLKGNIEGGEYYDWYYADATARAQQTRTPIDDGLDKEFTYRRKDVKGWWQNQHFPRHNGAEIAATAWQPQSKPIWFTEIGCPAVDKGTNEPNKFPDFKSVEAGLPFASSGQRDDDIQRLYLQALAAYWSDSDNNPVSDIYNAPMIAADRMFIWAWDARPYPAFPHATDLWVDGFSWPTGHWINGRLSNTPLGDLVSDVSDGRIKLKDGVAALDGYVLDRILSPRQAVEPLVQAFGLAPVARGDVIELLPRSDVTAVDCDDDMHIVSAKQKTPQIRRVEKERLPTVLKLSYISADGDYRPALAEARRPDANQNIKHVQLPMVLSAPMAQQIAERMLGDIWIGREKLTITLPPSFAALQAGDVLTYKDAQYRITRLTDFGARQIEAERLPPALPARFVQAEEPTPTISYALGDAVGIPELVLAELPIYHPAAPLTPALAAYATPWGRGILAYNVPQSWQIYIDTPTLMGVTKSALASAPIGRWDKATKLQVELFGGEIDSKPVLDVLGGANKMAIETPHGWEIIQFTQARLVGTRLYELSILLRGQYGSEAVMVDMLAAGAKILVLENILSHFPASTMVGHDVVKLKAGPAHLPAHDSQWKDFSLTPKRTALIPLAPAHLRATKRTKSWHIDWIRRARMGGDDWQQADIGLDEPEEKYQLIFSVGSDVKRRVTVAKNSYVYTRANFNQDKASGTAVQVQVQQIGAQSRSGYSATINIMESEQ